jgi:hypothetical protein
VDEPKTPAVMKARRRVGVDSEHAPLAPVAVFSRRHPGGFPFQSLDPEASTGNVLVIDDHNRLAIRPDFFHPITARIVGEASTLKMSVWPASVAHRLRSTSMLTDIRETGIL